MLERRLPENRHVRVAMNMIVTEMDFQRQRWDSENEDRTPEEWVALFSIYLGKLASETAIYKQGAFSPAGYKKRLMQLSALTHTALEKVVKAEIEGSSAQLPIPEP